MLILWGLARNPERILGTPNEGHACCTLVHIHAYIATVTALMRFLFMISKSSNKPLQIRPGPHLLYRHAVPVLQGKRTDTKGYLTAPAMK